MNKLCIFSIFLYCVSLGQEKKDSINSKSNPFYEFKFRCFQLPGSKCPESLDSKDNKNEKTKKPQIKQPPKEEEPSAYYIYSKQA
ncbi:MAG: hypothetical protein MUW56_21585 [Chryseobacterium sp.]|uniref:hypothetical protein n=1 Tax=Chryseobacterium sp. TaxID=1871047 RepID=UPI0025C2DFFA|nr:hypothetical protein [Chryseobacterium sp.]MCJ7936147.1 hypothetical protein [Chryseobacterium sp.]